MSASAGHKSSSEAVHGPGEIKKPNGEIITLQPCGKYVMKDSETWIEIGKQKDALEQQGQNDALQVEAAIEVPEALADSDFHEFFFSTFDPIGGDDFDLKRSDGTPIVWNYVKGTGTLAQSEFPARPTYKWIAFQSEQASRTQLDPSFDADRMDFRLKIALRWATSLLGTLRAAAVWRNDTAGTTIAKYVSPVITPGFPNPLIECVSPADVAQAGGTLMTVRGRNLKADSEILVGHIAVPATFVSDRELTCTSPALSDPGEYRVHVVDSQANGGNGTRGWYTVNAT